MKEQMGNDETYLADVIPSEDGKSATWTAADGKVITFRMRSPKEVRRLFYEQYGYGEPEESDWVYRPHQSRFIIGADGRWVERSTRARSPAAIAAETGGEH
jgi:hypothetical protein